MIRLFYFIIHQNHLFIPIEVKRKKISKVLIANRGEIACRVIKTAKSMGIKTVAVYSSADQGSMHVEMADEAYYIGEAPSRDSYLRGDKILDIANYCGAQAIHPGYGFLSENADFAELCESQGIVFIGPPASAIRDMGLKSTSKQIMADAGVPIIEGYHGEDQADAKLKDEASRIGYPVMLKAVCGGGGKGMRIVMNEGEFDQALESARRESLKSFNDDKMIVEKYIEEPRHVEVQVFADQHGNAVYLSERDCSVQRRHQKIIEEAPAPGLSESIRHEIGAAAVRAAKAVNYVGAGTVEFIMDKHKKFFFMEMNTRLQVEHPVTELVTNTDLVEWQLQVASGKELPLLQGDIEPYGHAAEARIYAEDPNNNFLPGAGPLRHLKFPLNSDSVRIDTGVTQGDNVSVHYDPMIAKLIVWGEDRESALRKLVYSLNECHVVGLNTNLRFLTDLASHPEFIAGNVHTGFIQEHENSLFESTKSVLSCDQSALACLSLLLFEQKDGLLRDMFISQDLYSPWNSTSGLRFNTLYSKSVTLMDGESEMNFLVTYNRDGSYSIKLSDTLEMEVAGKIFDAEDDDTIFINAVVNGVKHTASVVRYNDCLHIFTADDSFKVQVPLPKFVTMQQDSAITGAGTVAPMTGAIIKVLVENGQKVEAGDVLMLIEAMKMEHKIVSPRSATVKTVLFQEGDSVEKDQSLIIFEESEDNE
ncbi:uncharacterized protein TRIADDRAFT_18834 [Trichoplax adhaerens]|uniref:Methylcrotonoyl-CoA carboxylase subunit alpha, mitochondrial n=1 Tax=Trichoplax adhaerens TaxID=10228 RepID=B3RIZ4_TRIAD|nr:hypothetical protein TRIADDRAFT_18834 [Trichoplax adhaerens]EDV29275.1 hypothetical protein TRIADDRAFT_18834 [Trichoplax adhaerens]|eukprot:XP_002108477.1 hypothetical protein TRIADDRAFT_18834 [Trichoplax adhaerens]